MSDKTGGPAFPTVDANREEDYGTRGLTKLEWFAGKALPAAMEKLCVTGLIHDEGGCTYSSLAKEVYDIAEAMLAESEKRK